MMHGVDSTSSMQRELAKRLSAAGLQNDCGSGGLFTAEVAIVAEAPGERESKLKLPLIGNSGQVLWEACRKMGLTRNNTYQTNVIKRQLVGVSSGRATAKSAKAVISAQEVNQYTQVLHEELALLPNLRYIVAAGNYALEALTGEHGISAFRGSVLPMRAAMFRDVLVVCCNNPAAVIHDPKLDLIFRMDIGKLRKLRDGTFRPQSINAIINPSFSQAMDYIAEAKRSQSPVATDIESMSNETACVGLALNAQEGMCINWRTQSSNHYTRDEEISLRLALQDLYSTPTVRFVAQNGMFDSYWQWYKDRLRIEKIWFDTMLAHHTLYPSLPHGLGFLVSTYTDNPYYKDEGHAWKGEGEIDDFWRYNVKDCCHLLPIQETMLGELQDQGLDSFFFNHVMRLQPHLVRMTVGGVLADKALKNKLTTDLSAALEIKLAKCQETARIATGNPDYTYNPGSWQQLQKLFFNELKLVGRGNSTDKDNRVRMIKHPRTSQAARDVITAIDDYAEDKKFFSTYVNATIDEDDRFRCEYKQTGVQSAPGRLSSAAVMWGSGLNLQNIPQRAQPMIIVDEGYEFSYFDMSQVEARLVGVLANIPKWKADFERARLNPGTFDAHKSLAADMWKLPYEQVPTKDFEEDSITGLFRPTIRYKAKRARHGLNYRMQADTLATKAGLPLSEAEDIYRIYHRTTPEIKVWWGEVIARAKRDRQLTTALGRRWILLEAWSEEAVDSIIAFEPQSINGDWVSSLIWRCESDDRWPRDARMVLNIHDALIAINRVDDGPLVRSIMREHAETPLIVKGEELIMPAEFGKSEPGEDGIHRWSTIKKLKTPPQVFRQHEPIRGF